MSKIEIYSVSVIYQAILRRTPSAAEKMYWRQFRESGGTSQEVRAELTRSYEFEMNLKILFWNQYRRRPSPLEVAACRSLVDNGKTTEESAVEVGRSEIISGLLKVA